MTNQNNLPFNYKIVLRGTGNDIKTQMNLQDLYTGSDRQFTKGFLSVQSVHLKNDTDFADSQVVYLTSDLYFPNSYEYDESKPQEQNKSNILAQIVISNTQNFALEKCLSWKSEGVFMNYLPRFLDLKFNLCNYDLTPFSTTNFTIILSLDLFE